MRYWQNTCFKSPENPSCIDNFFINSPVYFQDNHVLETCTWVIHKIIVTILRTRFKNQESKSLKYRNYENQTRLSIETVTGFVINKQINKFINK